MTPMSWQISCSECDVGPNVDSELEKEGIVSISRELPNKQHDSVQLSSTGGCTGGAVSVAISAFSCVKGISL